MGAQSGIEWLRRAGGPSGATWNPWQGCDHVSEGCANCYMYAEKKRYGQDPTTVVRSKPPTFNLPLKLAPGTLTFVCSWSDFFHADADAWRADAWAIMRARPDVTFIIVTKRHGRMAKSLPHDWGGGWEHVWLLVSVETEEWAARRIPVLLDTPAAVRGVSYEPMLEDVDFSPWLTTPSERIEMWHTRGIAYTQTIARNYLTARGTLSETTLDWIICGGESGSGARPNDLRWMRGVGRDVALHTPLNGRARAALFFKQTGSNATDHGSLVKIRSHKGGDIEDLPPDLRLREFPDERVDRW